MWGFRQRFKQRIRNSDILRRNRPRVDTTYSNLHLITASDQEVLKSSWLENKTRIYENTCKTVKVLFKQNQDTVVCQKTPGRLKHRLTVINVTIDNIYLIRDWKREKIEYKKREPSALQ